MKSLKGRFIKTTILMVIISAALVTLLTLLLLLLFSIKEPYGFTRVLEALKEIFGGGFGTEDALFFYAVLWALLSMLVVTLTSIALSAKLSRDVLLPLKELKTAADKITEGDLNFEVMACDDMELNDLCSSFDEVRKKLKYNREKEYEIKEERNMLLANLSHDMRTPITTIKGYLEGIKDGVANTPEKMDKYLDTIYSKALVLQKLVDNMAEYSELELGRMQYAFEFINFNEFFQELIEGYEQDVSEVGITLESSITKEKIIIVGDTAKLKRVFDNLMNNAVKYNKEKGVITVTVETEGNGVLMCISDTGHGIKNSDINKVFDGFYRGDAARSNIKGNGLGLGISKQIVEKHHGKIWIKSQEGIGTDVFVYLPRRE